MGIIIVGGLIDSGIGILTGTAYGLVGAASAVLASIIGG